MINPIKSLGYWINCQTNGSLIILHNITQSLLKKNQTLYPTLINPHDPACVSPLGLTRLGLVGNQFNRKSDQVVPS